MLRGDCKGGGGREAVAIAASDRTRVCIFSMWPPGRWVGGCFLNRVAFIICWTRRISRSRYERCGTKARGDAWAARQTDGEASWGRPRICGSEYGVFKISALCVASRGIGGGRASHFGDLCRCEDAGRHMKRPCERRPQALSARWLTALLHCSDSSAASTPFLTPVPALHHCNGGRSVSRAAHLQFACAARTAPSAWRTSAADDDGDDDS